MTSLAPVIMVVNRGNSWTVTGLILVAALYARVVNVVCLIIENKR